MIADNAKLENIAKHFLFVYHKLVIISLRTKAVILITY